MRRFLVLIGLLAVTAAGTASGAAAEHVGETLDCGTAGTFTIAAANGHGFSAHVPPGETNAFFLADTTSVLIIKASYADGVLRFANPGFTANDKPLVTCTFSGPSSGRVYTVIGILT